MQLIEHPGAKPRRKSRKGVAVSLLVIAALAGGGVYYWQTRPVAKPVARQAPAIPVTVTRSHQPRRPDLSRRARHGVGLQWAQAFNFTEGQDVKAGDVLAQIDPRPFQAALDLAQATKAKDQAQLENAKLDLQRYQKAGTARQHAAADRHAGGARPSARGHGPGRSGQYRSRPSAARLHHNQGAPFGTHRHPAARPGQHRARHRYDRPGRDHAIAADLGGLHSAAGSNAGGHPCR